MFFKRVRLHGEAIVVVFDICSSTDILETLTLRGDVSRFQKLLTKIKHHLADAQRTVLFEPYKFVGDGWILLFPAERTDGNALLQMLSNLCAHYRYLHKEMLTEYLDVRPKLSGITIGIEKGPLTYSRIFQVNEYIGRAINVACRLQSSVKGDRGSPAYKALVSNQVFNEYFAPAEGYKVSKVRCSLRNIKGGANFYCRKIALLSAR